MTERILNELASIKAEDTNLQQHLKQFISTLLIDRGDLSQFEAYSSQHRISHGTAESVFRVREAYSHLKDYETKHRALLSVSFC